MVVEEDKLKNFINLALDLGTTLAELSKVCNELNPTTELILKYKKAQREIWKMKAINETYALKKKNS